MLAIDSLSWSDESWSAKVGFGFVRGALNSKVENRDLVILDINPEKVGVFDLVLILGVLYHMRHL